MSDQHEFVRQTVKDVQAAIEPIIERAIDGVGEHLEDDGEGLPRELLAVIAHGCQEAFETGYRLAWVELMARAVESLETPELHVVTVPPPRFVWATHLRGEGG